MRKTLMLAAATTALVGLGASPALALGVPNRPAGSVVTEFTSDNGGDNGWGNCGHNSSGGLDAVRLGTAGAGNGGYKPWEQCPTTPAATTTAGNDITISTAGVGVSYS